MLHSRMAVLYSLKRFLRHALSTVFRVATFGCCWTRNNRRRRRPVFTPPRLVSLRSRVGSGPGDAIRNYVLELSNDHNTTFSRSIENFITCTLDSKETSPLIVMRNMRQFMSGMKNYLVKHGEGNFDIMVQRERDKLRSDEFLNLDALLESVLQHLVVEPLRKHLGRLFVEQYSHSGAIQQLAESIQRARGKSLKDLGVMADIIPPTGSALELIQQHMQQLQSSYSALEKLDHLLSAIRTLITSVRSSKGGAPPPLGADSLLPLLVWVLVRANLTAAEVEADYMWGLLPPALLSGEGGYYLTTLSSAVHVLKHFDDAYRDQGGNAPGIVNKPEWGMPGTNSSSNCASVMRVVVPDEFNGSIVSKTLPVRPHMTTRELCKIVAHKARITNPQDYGLFKLVDGEETLLQDSECPVDVRAEVQRNGKHCMFAYKRIDAKIAWPRSSPP